MFTNTKENHYSGKEKEFNLPTWFNSISLQSFSSWVVAHFEKRIFLCYQEDSMNKHSKMPIELREEYTNIWRGMEKDEREGMILRSVHQLDTFANQAFSTHRMRVGFKNTDERKRDPAIRNMSWDEIMFKNIFMLVPSEQQRDYNLYTKEQLMESLERRILYQSNVASTNFVYSALTPNLKDAMKMDRFCMNTMVMYLHDRYIQKNIDDLLEEESQKKEVRRGKKRRKGGKAKARKKRKREKKEREKMRRKLEEQLSKNQGDGHKNKTFSTNDFEVTVKEKDQADIEIKRHVKASIKKVAMDIENFEKEDRGEQKFMAVRAGPKVTEEELRELLGEDYESEEAEVTIERIQRPKKDEFMERLKANIRKKGDTNGILEPLLNSGKTEGYKVAEGVSWEKIREEETQGHTRSQELEQPKTGLNDSLPKHKRPNFAKRTPTPDKQIQIQIQNQEAEVEIVLAPKKSQKQIINELATARIKKMVFETRKGPFKTKNTEEYDPFENKIKETKSLCTGSVQLKRMKKIPQANPVSEAQEVSVGTTGMTQFWDDAELVSIATESAYTERVKMAVQKIELNQNIDEVRSQSCQGQNLFNDGSGEGKIASEGNKSVQTAHFMRNKSIKVNAIGAFGVSSLRSEGFSKHGSSQKTDSVQIEIKQAENVNTNESKPDAQVTQPEVTAKDIAQNETKEKIERVETSQESKESKESKETDVEVKQSLPTKIDEKHENENAIKIQIEKESEGEKNAESKGAVTFENSEEKMRESKSECRKKKKKERKPKEKKITLRKSKKGRRNKQNKTNQRQRLVGKGVSRKRQEETAKLERGDRKKLERANFQGKPQGGNKFWNSKAENQNTNLQSEQKQQKQKKEFENETLKSSIEQIKQTKIVPTFGKQKEEISIKKIEPQNEDSRKESEQNEKPKISKKEVQADSKSKQIPATEESSSKKDWSKGRQNKKSKDKNSVKKWEKESKKSPKLENTSKTQKKNEKRKKKNKKRNKSEQAARKKRKAKDGKNEPRNNPKIQTWDEVEESVATIKSIQHADKIISNEAEKKSEIQTEKTSPKNSLKTKEGSKKEKPTRTKKKTGKRKKGKNQSKNEKRGRDFKTGTWQEAEDVRPVVAPKKKIKSRLRKNCKPFEFQMKPNQGSWNINPYARPYGYLGNPMMPPQSQGSYFQRFMNPSNMEKKPQGMMNDNSLSPIQNRPIPNVQFFGDFNNRRRATSNALTVAPQSGLAKGRALPNVGSSKNIGMTQPLQNMGMVLSMNINTMSPIMAHNMNSAPPGMTPNINTLSLNMPPMLNLNSGSRDLSNDMQGDIGHEMEEKSRVSLNRSHEPLALKSHLGRRDSDPFHPQTTTESVHQSLRSKSEKSPLLKNQDFPPISTQETLELKLSRLVEEQRAKVHRLTETAFESFSHRSLMKIQDSLKTEADMLEPHRQIILERIQNIVLKSFRSDAIQVMPYGSYATKLLTPFSDLDLAITFTDYREVSHERTIQILNTLENNLGLFDFVLEKKNVSSASVPVIKIVADASVAYKELPRIASESRHIKVDIIVGSVDSSGRANSAFLTTEVITNYIHTYPSFYSLSLFFKYALAANNLSNAFGGGLSAYGLCLLLISFLYYDSQENASEFGQASLRFMHFLVHSFKPSVIAVNPAYVGYSREQVFAGMPTMMGCQLFIADPTSKITKNVTPSCYRLYEVIDFFTKALDTLLRARSFMELKLLRKLQETINKDIPSTARLQFEGSNHRLPSDSKPQAFSLQAFTQSSVVMSQFDEKFKKNTAMDPRAEVLSHGPSPHFGAPLYKKVSPQVYQERCASYSVKVRSEAQFRLISKSNLNISENNPISQLPQEEALTATTNNTASKNQTKKSPEINSTHLISKIAKRDSGDSNSHSNFKQNVTPNSKQMKDVPTPQSAKKVDSNEKYIFQSQDPTTELSQEKKDFLKSEELASKIDADLKKKNRNIEHQIENLKEFKIDKEHLVKLFEQFYPDLFKTAFNLTGKAQSECESVGHEKLQDDMNFNAQLNQVEQNLETKSECGDLRKAKKEVTSAKQKLHKPRNKQPREFAIPPTKTPEKHTSAIKSAYKIPPTSSPKEESSSIEHKNLPKGRKLSVLSFGNQCKSNRSLDRKKKKNHNTMRDGLDIEEALGHFRD